MTLSYLLDTNTVSYIAKGKSFAARARLEALGEEETVCISSITEAELRYGLAKRPTAHRLRAAVEAMLFKLPSRPWASQEAVAYADLRAKLEAKGVTLSEMDLQIASHAVALNAILVTNDNIFEHVEDLRSTENWATDL
jgi:tRNA(fMet)-specific endonuclease VapC